jgi:uncharacterized membrane protein YfcA
MVSGLEFLLIGIAAVIAGAVNALAGGGTLITFPMLTFVGVPAVVANITNTVALCPGYLGATWAQRSDLKGQTKRLWLFLPISLLGGILGGILLLNTGEKIFQALVPWLILLASGLLATQNWLRNWLMRRSGETGTMVFPEQWAILPVGIAAIYGGYFGAGLSVIILAVLGVLLNDSLRQINALKQAIAFSVNISVAIFFVFSGNILWSAALVMAIGALIGGIIGGRIASLIKPELLRQIVVSIGVIVAIIYLVL